MATIGVLRTSNAALNAIASGSVGMAGSTGVVLQSGVRDAASVLERLLDEVYARRPKHSLSAPIQ